MNLGLKPKKLHELWESQLLARETGYEKYIKQTHEDTQNNIDELIRLLKWRKRWSDWLCVCR